MMLLVKRDSSNVPTPKYNGFMHKVLACFLLLGSCGCLAADRPAPQALILCYPIDGVIKTACESIEAELKKCGFNVTVLSSPRPAGLRTRLAGENFPSHMPVFVVGHGAADLVGGEHYIQLRHFQTKPDQPIPKEVLEDPANTVRSRHIVGVLNDELRSPSRWFLSCFSGATCDFGGSVGSSCKSWEPSTLGKLTAGPFATTRPIDPMTHRVIRLLCDAAAFEAADANLDKTLNTDEIKSVDKEFTRDGERCFQVPVKNEQEAKLVVERVKREMNKDSELKVENGTPDPKTGRQRVKLTVCENYCVAGGNWGKLSISPRLDQFDLHSPLLQTYDFHVDRTPIVREKKSEDRHP